MKVNRKVLCPDCEGSGSKKGKGTCKCCLVIAADFVLAVDTKCSDCSGSGRVFKTIRQGNTIYQTQAGKTCLLCHS